MSYLFAVNLNSHDVISYEFHIRLISLTKIVPQGEMGTGVAVVVVVVVRGEDMEVGVVVAEPLVEGMVVAGNLQVWEGVEVVEARLG